MLKGSREGIVRRIQPVSIHGQISLDVQYVLPEDPNGQIQVARLGPEAVENGIEPGDRVMVEFLLGVATSVRRIRPGQA
jgi:hypothetical protein